MKAYTDYPIIELGDAPGVEAPIREVEVVSFDRNKYCYIVVDGVETSVKLGYLYRKPGRCGEVRTIDVRRLKDVGGRFIWKLEPSRSKDTTYSLYTDSIRIDFENKRALLKHAMGKGLSGEVWIYRSSDNQRRGSSDHYCLGDISSTPTVTKGPLQKRIHKLSRGRKVK